MTRTQSAGFTWVELAVAMLILGILASLALAKYDTHLKEIQTNQAIGDIRAIMMMLSQYEMDNRAYPISLNNIGQGQLLDPWGKPYAYLNHATVKGKGPLGKDKKLNPINTDYDLYSFGPDGKSSTPLTAKDSQDDIIRANDGAFVDIASKY